MDREKLIKQLFVGKVTEIIGAEKTTELLKDATVAIDEILKSRQTDVSDSLPSQELIEMLKECRDMLVMCTLIDKSGQCQELVDKVDAKTGW